jgi:dTMP kinase
MREDTQLIVFEGLDGSGKSSQIKLLRRHLLKQGRTVDVLTQPGPLRRYLPQAGSNQLYIFLADQALCLETIRQSQADYILSDRWTISTPVYGDYNRYISQELHDMFPAPDLLIFLDTLPELARARAINRNSDDKFDMAPLELYVERRRRYLEILQEVNYPVITYSNEIYKKTHGDICIQLSKLPRYRP